MRLLFGPFPLAAIFLASAGDDDGLADPLDQLLNIGLLGEMVETQLDDVAIARRVEQVDLRQLARRGSDSDADHVQPPRWNAEKRNTPVIAPRSTGCRPNTPSSGSM